MAYFVDDQLAERAGRVAGEAGIAHLRAPLAGIRYHHKMALEIAVAQILETLEYRPPANRMWQVVTPTERIATTKIPFPTFTINRRFGKPTGIHGRYHRETQNIEIAPLLGLATALHELAHHINNGYGGRGHDKGFKRICGNLYKAAADHYGLKAVRAGAVELAGKRPRHGQTVKIDHPRFRGREFKVTKVNRTRAKCQHGDETYMVPFRLIVPITEVTR